MSSADGHTIFCPDPCGELFFGHSCAIKSREFCCASETIENLIVPLDRANDVGSEATVSENFISSLQMKISISIISSFLSKVVSTIR